MILQSLVAYYDRLLDEGNIQPPGLQEKEIHWAVEIDETGVFIALKRTGDGKHGKRAIIPAEINITSNIAANLLWGNVEYALGAARPGTADEQAAKVPRRHAAFIERIRTLPDDAKADPGVAAVLAFYAAEGVARARTSDTWDAMVETGGNVSFQLRGDDKFVCERPAVHKTVRTPPDDGEKADAPWCLITGKRAPFAHLHPLIKGVHGARTTGARIVSFNLPAFVSHGWVKGANAPIGAAAANAYVAALNHLLARDNETHHRTEDAITFVFWAARKTVMEDAYAHLLGGESVALVEQDGQKVANVFDSLRKGLAVHENDDTPFYVLGLAPNAARLAVRFWYEGAVADIAERFARHFDDLEIADASGQIGDLGLWRLLDAAARNGKAKNMKGNLRGALAAEVIAAILKNAPYPHTLLARTVQRCRSERSVWPIRASLIKAVLNRRVRHSSSQEKEVTVSLDPDNANVAYLLGRLFAAFEDVQYGAQKDRNATIRDRYFAAAITSPRSVFVQLSKLKNAHIKKLKRINPGHAVNAEKRIGAITDKLSAEVGFPAFLSLDDQGRFILGYHHQNQKIFSKPTPHKET